MPENEKTVCVILSGGASSRMKMHKALLKISEEKNFLQHIIDVYQKAGIDKIFVVKNSNIDIIEMGIDPLRVSIIDNYYPDRGRIYSLQLGLNKTPNANYCFIQNIDNPLISVDLLSSLYSVRTKADYISPEYNNIGGHPIIISSSVIKNITSSSTDQQHTLRDILQPHSRHILVTNDEGCIMNINLPSDYNKVILTMNKNHVVP